MDNKTIEICPHCGRLAWWPEFVCVHCGSPLTNYKRWMAADENERKEILIKIKQPKEYKPLYGPNDHPERLEKADRVDAQIRKYLAEQGSKTPEKKPTPKYVHKCLSHCSVFFQIRSNISSNVKTVGMSGDTL